MPKTSTWTHDEVLAILRDSCAKTTQRALAEEMGIGESYLSRVLNEKDPVTPKMAEWLLRHPVEVYDIRMFRKIA